MNFFNGINKSFLIVLGTILVTKSLTGNAALPEFVIVDEPPKPAYFSALFGYSSVNYTNSILQNGITAKSITGTGTGIKVALGYDFARLYGAEFGIIYFNKPAFRGISGLNEDKTIKNNVIYLAAKLNLPLGSHFFATGKAGIGYVARNGIVVNGVTALKEGELARPVYGAGLGWIINPRWVIESNWIQAAPSHNDQLPASNYYGIGFQYRFSL